MLVAMHGKEVTIVVLICFTLALGALLRLAATRFRFPYTLAVLAAGIAAGFFVPDEGSGHEPSILATVFAEGTALSPDLIIFVFLPALVFEAAFGLKVHAFRKNVGAVMVLAVPGLVLSVVATGALAVGLTAGSWQWGWTAALVFGALISATDPVAVVAILRECGAPKRLGVLIEGESLLNDGTAIVVFHVLIGVLIAGGWDNVGIGHTVLDFAIVYGLISTNASSFAIPSSPGARPLQCLFTRILFALCLSRSLIEKKDRLV